MSNESTTETKMKTSVKFETFFDHNDTICTHENGNTIFTITDVISWAKRFTKIYREILALEAENEQYKKTCCVVVECKAVNDDDDDKHLA